MVDFILHQLNRNYNFLFFFVKKNKKWNRGKGGVYIGGKSGCI